MRQRAALVAYEQSNDSYDVHKSTYINQNLQLCERITEETPYGDGGHDYEPELVEEGAVESYLAFQQAID